MTARTNRSRTPRWKLGVAATASAVLLVAGTPLLGTAGAGAIDDGRALVPAPLGDELPPNKPLCTSDDGGPGESPDDCADEVPCLLGSDAEGCGDSRVGGDLSPVVDGSGDEPARPSCDDAGEYADDCDAFFGAGGDDPGDGGGTPDDGVSMPTCADDPTDQFVDYCETYVGGGGTDPGASPDPCDSDPSGGAGFGGYDCRSGFAALTAVPDMIVAALTGGGSGGGGGAPSCSDDPSGQFAEYCEQFSGGQDGSGGGDSGAPADAISCDNAPDSYQRDCDSGYAWLSALVKNLRRMTYGDPSDQLGSGDSPTPRALCDAFATLGYTGSECYDYYEEWGASYFEPEEESADCSDGASDDGGSDDDGDACDSDTGDSSNG